MSFASFVIGVLLALTGCSYVLSEQHDHLADGRRAPCGSGIGLVAIDVTMAVASFGVAGSFLFAPGEEDGSQRAAPAALFAVPGVLYALAATHGLGKRERCRRMIEEQRTASGGAARPGPLDAAPSGPSIQHAAAATR